MIRRLIGAALALGLLSAPLAAQGIGQLPAGNVWGNPSGSQAVASPTSLTTLFDSVFGNTRGAFIERGVAGWGLIAPGATAGVPLVTNGAGADPSYSTALVVGGGTGRTTLTNHSVLFGAGTAAITQLTCTGYLVGTGAGADPTCRTIAAADLPAFGSGDVSFAAGGGAGTIAANAVTNAKAAQGGANTVKGNFTASTANEADNAVPSCSTTNSGLTYTTSSGLGCNANLASLTVADQTMSGGANVTSQSLSTGNITVDCGSRQLQFITNNGAWTITAPANDGSCAILITNGATAATPTFSGFSVGTNVGDPMDNVNAHKFILQIMRINATSTYAIKALQ